MKYFAFTLILKMPNLNLKKVLYYINLEIIRLSDFPVMLLLYKMPNHQ